MTISRRRFVQGVGMTGLALVAGCGRLPWQAQAKVARIGVLVNSVGANADRIEAFRQGLREFGYVEGQSFAFEVREANDEQERYPALVAELTGLEVDVIVAQSTPAVQATLLATRPVPVIMVNVADPVGAGLVGSLGRPGGNATGLSAMSPQLAGKRLELLKEVVPGLARVAILWNPDNPSNLLVFNETQAAADSVGVTLRSWATRAGEDFESAFDAASVGRIDAVLVPQDPYLFAHRTRILALAAKYRLPTMYPGTGPVEAGALMGYGPSVTGMWHRAAYYVDRILKGTPPADLPIEQPREFEFVINLKTAQALGLTIPPHVLLQATEVIQ